MKKKALSLLLALVMCLGLLPATASAAETNRPDWYFLFAVFKNVDAYGISAEGEQQHAKYTMPQAQIDFIQETAQEFENYMNSFGVMRAHVDTVEIDTTVTKLKKSSYGSYLGTEQAAPLLEGKVDLDKYDHVTCVVSLNDLHTTYSGICASAFTNGTGHSCVNLIDWEHCYREIQSQSWRMPLYVHEFLHFMESMDKKWGAKFNLHDSGDFYKVDDSEKNYRKFFRDIMLNRAKGGYGTGVHPAVWQYPPHVLRTMTELTVPKKVTGIGSFAFQNAADLTKVTIPGSAANIGYAAFCNCTGLTEVNLLPGVTEIEDFAFRGCPNLTKISIPASVTKIGYVAIGNVGTQMEVYYGGTEEQWNAIQVDEQNIKLTRAIIHYNCSV